MILERNRALSRNRILKIKGAKLCHTLLPSLDISLTQWLSRTLLEYGGVIFFKYQGNQGSFDGTLDIFRYQQQSQGLFKHHPRSLSLVLNRMINSVPQDKYHTLDR